MDQRNENPCTGATNSVSESNGTTEKREIRHENADIKNKGNLPIDVDFGGVDLEDLLSNANDDRESFIDFE